jgi:hypothetical protein
MNDEDDGQCARRAIVEAKYRSQWPVIGWVTKIYYLELLRVSEGTLSRWHLQSLAPTPVSRRVDRSRIEREWCVCILKIFLALYNISIVLYW